MKTTVVIDFELGLAWTLVEPEYRFDYDATQDALNILHNARMLCATEAGIGWEILYRSKRKLEAECADYFCAR